MRRVSGTVPIAALLVAWGLVAWGLVACGPNGQGGAPPGKTPEVSVVTIMPQQAVLKFSRKAPWLPRVAPLPHIPVSSSGEKRVAPPDAPTRNSLTRLAPKVDRSDSDVVHRVDCWLPVVANPGNGSCALLVVSGVELMWR